MKASAGLQISSLISPLQRHSETQERQQESTESEDLLALI